MIEVDDRRKKMMRLNNSGGNLRQQLLDGAPFLSELLYTAIPQRAAAGTTATFTRANPATFTDFEGVLRTAPAGCARFVGARFVRNLFSATENLSNAYWNKSAVTVGSATAVVAGITCQKIEETAVIAAHYIYNSSATFAGTKGIISAHVAKGERDICWLYLVSGTDAVAYFNLTNGTVGTVTGTASPEAEIEEVDGGYRISLKATVAPGTVNGGVGSTTVDGSYNVQGTLGYGIYVGGLQLEDITGRADQTTPSEYVSVGVESAPYHGAGADGCQFFDTDLDGNPIPSSTLLGYLAEGARTNLCLQSNAFTTTWTTLGTPGIAQNAIGPDGATSAWTLADNDPAATEAIQQAITLTAATHTISAFVGKTTGIQASYPVLSAYTTSGGNSIAICTVDTSNGVATVWTAYTGFAVVTSSARCTSFNDDFWRVELVFLPTAAVWNAYLVPAGTTNATQSTGTTDVTAQGSAVFYGAQVELGSFATSYIATTTAAVTRNADVLTYTGGDIPNLKTLMAGFRREVGVSSSGISAALSDGTFNNYEMHNISTATDHAIQGAAGGATQWQISPAAYSPGSDSKVAWSVATNDIKAAFDGVGQTPDTVANVPAISELDVGHIGGSYQLSGNVGGIYGWTRNLSQSELNAVTQ